MRFILVFLCFLFCLKPACALDINNVRFGTHPDKERLVVELSQPAAFKAYSLHDPSRIALDLPDYAWKSVDPMIPSRSLIRRVSHSTDKGSGQIILELSAPAEVLSAFTLPAAAGQPDRIVVDFGRLSNPVAAAPPRPHSASTVQNLGVLQKAEPDTTAKEPRPALEIIRTDSKPAEKFVELQPLDASKVKDSTPAARRRVNARPLIIIDPGHGGQDPGARAANGSYEKSIVLAVGLELRRALEADGQYRVEMTRSTDVFIPLQDRVKFARRKGGDLFVSLHADSMPNASVTGASVYTLSETASDKVAERLAERENKSDAIAGVNLSNQDTDVANILIDLASRDTMNQSRFLATTVVTTLPRQGVRMLPRAPHRSAGFAVLKALDIPSILVEMGFLTNPEEAARLSSQNYRKQIAQGLKSSIDAYFLKVARLSQ